MSSIHFNRGGSTAAEQALNINSHMEEMSSQRSALPAVQTMGELKCCLPGNYSSILWEELTGLHDLMGKRLGVE
jgi:hypothetical protein